MGTIQLKVQAKMSDHLMTLHVMDNLPPHNTILDREWLHIIGKILPCYLGIMTSNGRLNTRKTEESMLRRMTLVGERKTSCKLL